MILPWRQQEHNLVTMYHFTELEQCNGLMISGLKMERINQVATGKVHLQTKILISSTKPEAKTLLP